MADPQVRKTQQWLNTTYGSKAGWVRLEEDGLTGWSTIYGLRRALQAELGISQLASGFGPATTSAFRTKIGKIDASFTGSQNILCILSGALWCKGYTAITLNPGAVFGFEGLSGSVASVRADLGLSTGASPAVDVKIMASLLSMDAYTILSGYGGTAEIQAVQRRLNGIYHARQDFALVPCDGVHSRAVQTALLLALQYELGMADGVANGNFGNGTKNGLKSQAMLSTGSVDGAKRFVMLFHAAMILNGLGISLNSSFTSTTSSVISSFQSFMEIPQTGKGDYTTWCSLLVSCGDTSIATKGFDTSEKLTGGKAAAAVRRGYTHVGRYLVTGNYISAPELDDLRAAGLRLIPLFQRFNNEVSYMTYDNGTSQAFEALTRARVLGLPAGSVIYFAVDFDATGDVVNGPVANYFQGVNDVMGSVPNSYQVGIYAPRNACQTMIDRGLAVGAYVSGMSTGYSGNMGYAMPQEWHYNQILETSTDLGGGGETPIDKVVVSRKAPSVDLTTVPGPPLENEGGNSATGFDLLFLWYVDVEAGCSRAVNELPYGPAKAYASDPSVFILGWLRKPTYWGTANDGMWLVYTPEVDDQASTAARVVCEDYLNRARAHPNGMVDIPHWAVSVLSYVSWGANISPAQYGYGDLGGWALDLYSLFGAWQSGSQNVDLYTWAFDAIGAESNSEFGRADLLADVDAWLVASSGVSPFFRERFRYVRSMSPNERLMEFYRSRFDSSSANVDSAFKGIAYGLDVGVFKDIGWTLPLLKKAAHFDSVPTEAQRRALTSALADRLVQGLEDGD
ncbi:glycoside hydrolase domain-containing protein [Actinomyces ruminicola]|uniref:glycoside hydrolase domain-containing protein n=1 Tax=Actinomyces ruminicola TaxID=332524 RepID=UPI0011C78409|nr:glycoside hydrolase domain-containing protein [Actinomyces ruminicola]